MVIQGGRWLLWIENGGKRIFMMNDQKPAAEDLTDLLRSVAAGYLRLPEVRKIVIETWNNQPVLQSEAADVLKKLGAEADSKSLVIWPSALT